MIRGGFTPHNPSTAAKSLVAPSSLPEVSRFPPQKGLSPLSKTNDGNQAFQFFSAFFDRFGYVFLGLSLARTLAVSYSHCKKKRRAREKKKQKTQDAHNAWPLGQLGLHDGPLKTIQIQANSKCI